MKKIKFIIVAAVAMLIGASAFGSNNPQSHKEWRERMRAEKVAFLTSEMNLSPEEAQVFWPIYNQADAEKQASVKNGFKACKALQEAIEAGKGGKDVEVLLKEYLAAEKESKEVDERYLDKYLKVLPAEKVAKLYIAEEKFRRQQLSRWQGQGGRQMGQGGPQQGQGRQMMGEGRPQQGGAGRPGGRGAQSQANR